MRKAQLQHRRGLARVSCSDKRKACVTLPTPVLSSNVNFTYVVALNISFNEVVASATFLPESVFFIALSVFMCGRASASVASALMPTCVLGRSSGSRPVPDRAVAHAPHALMCGVELTNRYQHPLGRRGVRERVSVSIYFVLHVPLQRAKILGVIRVADALLCFGLRLWSSCQHANVPENPLIFRKPRLKFISVAIQLQPIAHVRPRPLQDGAEPPRFRQLFVGEALTAIAASSHHEP